MAKLDLNKDTAEQFIQRLEAIQGVEQRQRGTMGPEKLIRHLTYMFEVSLGEKEAEKIFMPMPAFAVWYLFFEWFTDWPKGKIAAPETFFPEETGELPEAKMACTEALGRFVERLESHPEQTGFSPLLGQLPLRKWSRLHGVHMDHHLRQYGV